jgi:hypothetical protein
LADRILFRSENHMPRTKRRSTVRQIFEQTVERILVSCAAVLYRPVQQRQITAGYGKG